MSIENPTYSGYEDGAFEGAEKLKKEQNQTTGNTNDAPKIPADGTKVGNPEEQKIPDIYKNKPDIVPVVSVSSMTEQASINKETLAQARRENPEWDSAKGNPEAEQQLAGNLEMGLNQVA